MNLLWVVLSAFVMSGHVFGNFKCVTVNVDRKQGIY